MMHGRNTLTISDALVLIALIAVLVGLLLVVGCENRRDIYRIKNLAQVRGISQFLLVQAADHRPLSVSVPGSTTVERFRSLGELGLHPKIMVNPVDSSRKAFEGSDWDELAASNISFALISADGITWLSRLTSADESPHTPLVVDRNTDAPETPGSVWRHRVWAGSVGYADGSATHVESTSSETRARLPEVVFGGESYRDFQLFTGNHATGTLDSGPNDCRMINP
ncbi:MAG: hypothetical protein JJU36_09970 [Phycisphaeraceae bacterium]|nr:hypothetical protein [Phycisphaeraceae bacterium]